MFELDIICVGTLKEQYLRDACAEYQKRLTPWCKLRIIELKEDAELIPALPKKGWCCALCVEGKQQTSEEFAATLGDLPSRGYSNAALVIGGSDGLPEEVKAACHARLSFSKMTFPHQLMRVILLEQVYRAFNINHGGKYHK
ncbi:MAG: 23S rRNA (pseudouridine(1915)-N(3))-methyltransferase RlmH [Clostridia bacterium]|nr:23S rRNA (pseudouridine(1915)-N(3))-methyltransferase RlmH [Clostridia bacterium]